MKKILILIFIPIIAISQSITIANYNFLNFSLTVDVNTEGLWELKDANAHVDLSGNSSDLTANNFSEDYVDELQDGSPYSYNDSTIYFTASQSEYFNRTDNDFSPSGDFTIDAWVKVVPSVDMIIFCKMKNSGNYDGYVWMYDVSGNAFDVWLSTGAAMGAWYSSDAINDVMEDNSWRHIAVVWTSATTTLAYYVDGVAKGTSSGVQPSNTTEDIFIGKDRSTNYSYGNKGWIRWSDKARSIQELKEAAFLANGWYSKNGGVARDELAFHQGIVADTVYTPLSDITIGTNKIWKITLDAYSSSGTQELTIFTDTQGTSIKNVTTSNTSFTAFLSSENFSSDSLYFSTSGTVYIDNIQMEAVFQGYRPQGYPEW